MTDLLDVNIVFALLHPRHRHTSRVLAWLAGKQDVGSLLVCRVVQMGVLRLLTQPGTMQDDLMTPIEFWEGWDSLLRDDRFVLVEEEPADLEKRWRELCSALPKGKIAETDTYLAAFALAGGYTLATFDRGFARFEGLRAEIL